MTSARVHLRTVAIGVLAAILLSACGGDDDGSSDGDAASTTTSAAAGTDDAAVPAGPAMSTAAEALEALLAAEQAGDHAASYALLSSDGRRDYPNVDEWARDRQQLAPITAFEVRPEDDEGVVEALVEHEPGLDPFVGLSVGRELQRWEAVEEDGRWLLDADPEIEPMFPPDEDAIGVAQAWIDAATACDEGALAALEGVAQLFGNGTVRAELCDSGASLQAVDVDEVRSGPASSELVTQYSGDALVWARSVAIEGAPAPMEVILAPIGDDWRVIGVLTG